MNAILKDKYFQRAIVLSLFFLIVASLFFVLSYHIVSFIVLAFLPIVLGFSIGSFMSSRNAFVISMLLSLIVAIPIFMGVFRYTSGEWLALWSISLYVILLIPIAFSVSVVEFLFKRYKTITKS